MSVLRQANILGQQRLDVPHIRGIESSVAADFDLLAGRMLAGSKALVVTGFNIITTSAIGNPATSLQLNVANGMVLHPLASEAGTIFQVASDAAAEVLNNTNANVTGSFTPGQTNYVGLDLRRAADTSTSDLVMFLDATTLLETPKTTPLARTLKFKIIISTTDFSSVPHVLPLAKVVVASTGNVTSLEDARTMLYRLGSGGSTPNKLNSFTWPSGRNEKVQDAATSVFEGADKGIASFKDHNDAILTRLWELGGGEFWYSATSDRDVKVVYDGASLLSNGDNLNWTLATQTLDWSGISVVFANSTAIVNTVTNGVSTPFADGDCLYVDLDRASAATLIAAKAPMATLGSPTVPGSRLILVWRRGNFVYARDRQYEVNRSNFLLASPTVTGVVRLSRIASTPATPVVISDTGGSIASTAGLTALSITSSAGGIGIWVTGGTGGQGALFSGGSGGSGNNSGVEGVGAGTQPGVLGQGPTRGGLFLATAGNGSGASGQGFGTGAGLVGLAAGVAFPTTAGEGIYGEGLAGTIGMSGGKLVGGAGSAGAGGKGVHGVGGDGTTTGGPGVYGEGCVTAPGSYGVRGLGTWAGAGGYFQGGSTSASGIIALAGGAGIGGEFYAGSGLANGIKAQGGTTAGAYGGQFLAGGGDGGGLIATASGDGIAGSFTASGATKPAIVVTTGYADLPTIDRPGAGAIAFGGTASSINVASPIASTQLIATSNSVSIGPGGDFLYTGAAGTRWHSATIGAPEIRIISNGTYTIGAVVVDGPYIAHTAIGSPLQVEARCKIPEGAVVVAIRAMYGYGVGSTPTPLTLTADAAIEKWTGGGSKSQSVILNAATITVAANTNTVTGAFAAHTNQTMQVTDTTVGESSSGNGYMWLTLSVPLLTAGVFKLYGFRITYTTNKLRQQT